MPRRTHLYNAVQLDVVHALPDLISAGLTALMVDTTLMNVEQTTQAVARVVRARNVANSSGSAIAKRRERQAVICSGGFRSASGSIGLSQCVLESQLT